MSEDKRIVITIDGVAASGKSSLARALAEKLSCSYLNSGNLYRAIAVIAKLKKVSLSDEEGLIRILRDGKFELKKNDQGAGAVFFEGTVLSAQELESVESGRGASKIAPLAAIRAFLLPIQKGAFLGDNLVAEGRDMGTIVFPDAEVKVFVTADPKVRALRRAKQLNAPDAVKEIESELIERDARDAARQIAPLKVPEGAILFDNSPGDFKLQIEKLIAEVSKRLS